MNYRLKYVFQTALLGLISMTLVFGQEVASESKEAAYTRVTNERAGKIITAMGLSDSQKAERVKNTIAQQYWNLNAIHENRKAALSNLTEQAQKEKLEKETASKIATLHTAYLKSLAVDLTPEQIEQVKDGMTYGVVPITYKGYQQMLPDLTDEQKKQILAWLTEARERAMDEGTSDKKHAMFGKYKGRINNYLSAAGIDMKKASKEWEARIAREAGKSSK
ncbi:DUF3826 domain-containing protein [Spirosoma daeguense]